MDSTVAAIPVYFGTMGAEYLWLRGRSDSRGPTPADYERRDTVTSLTMGTASLIAPFVAPKLFGPVTPGKGKYGKALVATAVGAVAFTTVADLIARLDATDEPDPAERSEPRRRAVRAARRAASVGGVVAVVAGGIAVTTTLATRLTANRLWSRRLVRDLGTGPAAV